MMELISVQLSWKISHYMTGSEKQQRNQFLKVDGLKVSISLWMLKKVIVILRTTMMWEMRYPLMVQKGVL